MLPQVGVDDVVGDAQRLRDDRQAGVDGRRRREERGVDDEQVLDVVRAAERVEHRRARIGAEARACRTGAWCSRSGASASSTIQNPSRRRMRLVSVDQPLVRARGCSAGSAGGCGRPASSVTRLSGRGRSSDIASQSTPRATHASYAHSGIHGTDQCRRRPAPSRRACVPATESGRAGTARPGPRR